MREDMKIYSKYFLGVSILIYAIISILFKEKSFLDKLDLAVTISLILSTIYIELLWKYNPLEKKPKIYGKYNMTFISTYDSAKRTMKVEIKQNLFTNRIYITTKESNSESISSNIIYKKDSCELIYTYQNKPKPQERNHSGIHFGTCILKIVNNQIVSGEYYTDRKTTGEITKIEKDNTNSKS